MGHWKQINQDRIGIHYTWLDSGRVTYYIFYLAMTSKSNFFYSSELFHKIRLFYAKKSAPTHPEAQEMHQLNTNNPC